MSTLLALAVVAAAATVQAEPTNVRLRRARQEADSLVGQIRWTPPPRSRDSAVEGYEWRVVDDTVTLTGKVVVATDRAAVFAVPFPCGDTVNLRSRVRAFGTWDSVAAWVESEPQSFFRACGDPLPGPPTVELLVDTGAGQTLDTPSPPPSGVAPFFQTRFEANSLGGNAYGGFRFATNGTVGYPDAQGRTTGRAVKLRHVAGAPRDDAWAELRYDMGRNIPEVWIEFYQWISGDHPLYPVGEAPHFQYPYAHRDPGGNLNKWFWLWDSGGYPGSANGQIWFSLNARSAGGGPDSNLSMKWSAEGQRENTIENRTGQSVTGYIGRWVRMRFHARVASGANSNDGLIEMWWNDNRVFSLTRLDMYSSTANHFRRGYIGGWHNSGYDRQMVFLIDDLKFYDQSPGW